MNIKNIIFDLGAVVLNIDYEGPAKMLKGMGFSNFETFYSKAKQNFLFDNFEKGLISPEEFRKQFNELTHFNFSNELLDAVWNAIILDFPEERLNVLLGLKNNYKTFLLSNTNKIHYDYYTKQLNEKGFEWSDLFHKTYFSFEMGLRKPDTDIYLETLKDADIKPEETLFIDDILINLEPARACNIQTYWLKEGIELTSLFRNYKFLNFY